MNFVASKVGLVATVYGMISANPRGILVYKSSQSVFKGTNIQTFIFGIYMLQHMCFFLSTFAWTFKTVVLETNFTAILILL